MEPKITTGAREYVKTGVMQHDFPGFGTGTEWDIFSNDHNNYILTSKASRHVRFLEVYSDDGLNMITGREWQRRPRNDEIYSLKGPPKKYYGMKQPTSFTKKVRLPEQ